MRLWMLFSLTPDLVVDLGYFDLRYLQHGAERLDIAEE